MTDTRPVMLATAALFLALASLAEVALFYPLGAMSDAVARQPPVLIHVLAGSLAFAGILLIVFAPPSRRKERRVSLDKPSVEEQVLSPSRKSALPTTRGMEDQQAAKKEAGREAEKPKAPPPPKKGPEPEKPPGQEKPPARDEPSKEGSQNGSSAPPASPPRPATQPPKKAPAPSSPAAAGETPPAHAASPAPPEPVAEEAEPAAAPPSSTPPETPSAPVSRRERARHRGDLASDIGERRVRRVDTEARRPAYDPEAPDVEDPVALAERLEHLDRQANQLKVQFALGKLSPRGYRHMLETIDTERSRLEARLVEHQRFD